MSLISKETIEQIHKANEQRASGSSYLKKPCVEIMKIDDFSVGLREKGKLAGRPYLSVSLGFDNGLYANLEDEFFLTGDEGFVKYGLGKMAQLFEYAGHKLGEVKDLDHLKMLANNHLKGKKVAVAIKVKQTLWRRDGQKPVIVHNADPWYYGPVSSIEEMRNSFNESGAMSLLSEAERAELDSGVSVPASVSQPAQPAAATSAAVDALDDIP